MVNDTMENSVRVEERVTTDLGQTEEAVFEVIALNPDLSIEEIRDKYGLSPERVLEVTDSLQHSGYVRALDEDEFNDCVWEVTDLGRMLLLKMIEIMRFHLMEAKLRGQELPDVEALKDKKQAFETAYRQCKMLFEEGEQ